MKTPRELKGEIIESVKIEDETREFCEITENYEQPRKLQIGKVLLDFYFKKERIRKLSNIC